MSVVNQVPDPVSKIIIDDNSKLLQRETILHITKSNCRLVTYTSGTTGIPKRIIHSNGTLLRNIKIGAQYRNNVWGFAYNPAHYAGIQVLLQAFLNKNLLVQLIGATIGEIESRLNKFQISHLSATPSFIRNYLLPCKGIFPSVRSIVSGGEAFDFSLLTELKTKFPNARIMSIYALTEAGSLLTAIDGIFNLTDRINKLIRVSDCNELLVSTTLMNQGDITIEDEWYHTGDIVEFINSKDFRIIGRRSDIVNIGGLKVNPFEVEHEILKIDGVKDAAVCVRKNSVTGSILVSKLVIQKPLSEDNCEITITRKLGTCLQRWQIPKAFRVVERIEYTESGKKVRSWKS
jgi:acyl-coenzyme A synthetase/AMP-(fatty) acid ligase